jgi:hypothetical protein
VPEPETPPAPEPPAEERADGRPFGGLPRFDGPVASIPAAFPAPLELAGIPGPADLTSDRNRLFFLRRGGTEPLCFVPAEAPEDARTARADLCFSGYPADLADPEERWRLSGLTALPADAPEAAPEVTAEGEICLTADARGALEKGDLFRLLPGMGLETTPRDAGDVPARYRLCFDPVEEAEATLPEVDAAAAPQAPAPEAIALTGETGPADLIAALALMSAAMPARTVPRGADRTRSRLVLLAGDADALQED